MFKRKAQQSIANVKDVGTVIGNGIVLENINLKGLGVVRVDGVITGEIQLEGHLVLGETGKIIGDVHAGSAMFFGSFDGHLVVEDTLHIAASGKVTGDISTNKLIIDEGAEFHGTCNNDTVHAATKMISVKKEKPKEKTSGIEVDVDEEAIFSL